MLFPTPTPAAKADVVVVQSEGGGRLPLRTPPRPRDPTPTADLLGILATVAPVPTRTPGPAPTASPTLIPPFTSTPRPTPTFPRGSFPDPRTFEAPTRPPTRTPAPRGTFTGPGVEPPEPVETPLDFNEPNDTPARAAPLDLNPVEGYITSPDDVDVFRVDVSAGEADLRLVVTLSGPEANRYKVDVVAPRNGNVGRQRFDGTTALRASADVAGDVGPYYIYVRGVGNPVPAGPYFISADFTVAAPTATPTRTR